ncbi:Phosphatidylglycerol/phosphatidylinositol transfer protein [Entomophthora muscae]|uniref:Phosphatidylglycerol/phosphatidylinositol transfer protein n=1 Tax=Entomophthora muscae TaxID=34485 RepID=A0ACC2TLV7_9FUNG|nr:Phosphatidylglycerol/phosphatidylinositol transfer protein [Entomophthora muscae]
MLFSRQSLLGYASLLLAGFVNASFFDTCKVLNANVSLQDCSTSHKYLSVHKVTLEPKPHRGVVSFFTVEGEAFQEINSSATVNVILKLGFMPVLTLTDNFCNSVSGFGVECPIKKGRFFRKGKFEIPKDVPFPSLDIDVQLLDNGKTLATYKLDVAI